jgi:hypothetical protein
VARTAFGAFYAALLGLLALGAARSGNLNAAYWQVRQLACIPLFAWLLSSALEAADRAAAAGDRLAEIGLRIDHAAYQFVYEPTDDGEHLRALSQSALPMFEAAGDEWGSALACSGLALAAQSRSPWAEIAAITERAITHARRAGSQFMVDFGEGMLVLARLKVNIRGTILERFPDDLVHELDDAGFLVRLGDFLFIHQQFQRFVVLSHFV